MCGTFTALFGEALGLALVDKFLSPSIRGGEMREFIDFGLKGIVTFWIYRWAQCTPGGSYTKKPLHGMNFLTLFFGGMIGGITLMLSKSLLPRQSEIFNNDYMAYVIDAIIVNFVYGLAHKSIVDITE